MACASFNRGGQGAFDVILEIKQIRVGFVRLPVELVTQQGNEQAGQRFGIQLVEKGLVPFINKDAELLCVAVDSTADDRADVIVEEAAQTVTARSIVCAVEDVPIGLNVFDDERLF